MEKSNAPITLFVYNRLDHTRQTVESLRKNELAQESDLFIFSDGPKNPETAKEISEIRDYLKTITGFKSITVIEREKNIGLANSIIDGVTDIVTKYGKIIVLEDDLVTSPYFLSYMNQGLDMYEHEDKVASIHGYMYPTKDALPETFFIRGADCWGWATWKRAWNIFEPNGQKLLDEIIEQKLQKQFNFGNSYDYLRMLKGQIAKRNNSWAVRWYASAFLKHKLTLYPGTSLVKNIGFDGTGTHSSDTNIFGNYVSTEKITLKKIAIEESRIGRQTFKKFFKSIRPKLLQRLRNHIQGIKYRLKTYISLTLKKQ